MKYNDTIFKAASLANQESCREAKISNKPYGRLFTTTAGDLRYEYGSWCHEFFGRACRFDVTFYDLNAEEIAERIKKNSKNNMIYIEYSYRELGRSEDYFIEQCEALDYDQLKIQREVMNIWCSSSDSCPFNAEHLARIFRNLKDPIAHLLVDKTYSFEIYSEFDWSGPLMIGADVSAGASLDSSTLVLLDSRTFKTVALFKSNNIEPLELGDLLISVMTKYFKNSVLFCERNNNGKDTISHIMRNKPALKKRIYGEYKIKQTEKSIEDPKRNTNKKYEKTRVFEYGIDTNKKTRPQMFDILFKLVKSSPEVFVSRWIYNDINGLERQVTKTTERLAHSSKSHDDCLFGYLIPRWAWVHGTNMANYYIGYSADSLLTDEKTGYDESAKESTIQTIEKIARLNKLTTQISDYNLLLQQAMKIEEASRPIGSKKNFKGTVWELNRR